MPTTTAGSSMRDQVSEYIKKLQVDIVTAFEQLDPAAPPFKRDSWLRPQGGEGISCVFALPPSDSPQSASTTSQRETALEKAGVNISIVHGLLPPAAIKQMRADHSSIPYDPDSQMSLPFFAAGLSLVVHPKNPMAPTVHANYRYFEITEPARIAPNEEGTVKDEEKEKPAVIAWWFGGGSDLTPSYLFEEDAVHFHKTLKDACDKHGSDVYPAFKKWCDEYFYIPHRAESRGIGGLFFDDLTDDTHIRMPNSTSPSSRPFSPSDILALAKSLGDAFVPSYLPILQRRAWLPYTPAQRRWQLLRRGRYVEFNLVVDRGTKFGLATPGARIESVLMSLPAEARWEYMSEMGTEEDTDEAKLMVVLKTPREWV